MAVMITWAVRGKRGFSGEVVDTIRGEEELLTRLEMSASNKLFYREYFVIYRLDTRGDE